MKKIYAERKYTKWKATSSRKSLRAKPHRKFKNRLYRKGLSIHRRWENHNPIPAPSDFRFVDNTEECLDFFRKIRDKKNHYYNEGNYFVALELKKVQQIDYCSVSVLKALLMDFKPQNIFVQGNSPENRECFNFLKTSGYYDGLLSLTNKTFHEKGDSDRMVFTQGSGMLSDAEDFEVVMLLKKIRRHLTGQDGHCPQLRTIILEICGNSIEHSDSFKRQWTFGVKYEKNKVIITLIDTGKGILKTLYKRLGRKFTDFVAKTNTEVLDGAFNKKYESRTLDQNRNKGLPVIKMRFMEGYIKNLVVITNNVILNFEDMKKSQYFSHGFGFDGTIFKIELDKSCFNANK